VLSALNRKGTVRGTSAGTVLGVYRVPDGWHLLELAGKVETIPRFEELTLDLRQALAQEATQAMRERRLHAYTDSLRRAIPVTIDRGRLARVAWPPRGAAVPELSLGG
jgi:hypothetical protein